MAKDRDPITLETVEYEFTKPAKGKGGTPVFKVALKGVLCHCPKCGAIKPIADFGLRVAQGVLRNQAQCSSCR